MKSNVYSVSGCLMTALSVTVSLTALYVFFILEVSLGNYTDYAMILVFSLGILYACMGMLFLAGGARSRKSGAPVPARYGALLAALPCVLVTCLYAFEKTCTGYHGLQALGFQAMAVILAAVIAVYALIRIIAGAFVK